MMTNLEFVAALKKAEAAKTLYVMGGFGAPAGYGTNRTRYKANHEYNRDPVRQAMIDQCDDDTFFFDCGGLGKAILWGWDGKTNRVYGGAAYKKDDIPDFGANSAMSYCTEVSSNMNKIAVGEWLWMDGHVGFYVGDGQVIECTPSWKNCVQYTKLSQRKWQKHGKLRFISYVQEDIPAKTHTCPHCGKTFTEGETAPAKPAAPADPGYTVYTVARGDSLVSIARRYGTTYKKIAEFNGISNPSLIRVGQLLKIPKG